MIFVSILAIAEEKNDKTCNVNWLSSYSSVFVVNHSGVQPATQSKILGVHLPYFPLSILCCNVSAEDLPQTTAAPYPCTLSLDFLNGVYYKYSKNGSPSRLWCRILELIRSGRRVYLLKIQFRPKMLSSIACSVSHLAKQQTRHRNETGRSNGMRSQTKKKQRSMLKHTSIICDTSCNLQNHYTAVADFFPTTILSLNF